MLDWPEGVSVPNVGGDIHFESQMARLTVKRKTFEIVAGKVDVIKIEF